MRDCLYHQKEISIHTTKQAYNQAEAEAEGKPVRVCTTKSPTLAQT